MQGEYHACHFICHLVTCHISHLIIHISLVPVTYHLLLSLVYVTCQADTIEEMLGEYRARHAKSDPETPEEEQYIDYRSRQNRRIAQIRKNRFLNFLKLQEVHCDAGGVKNASGSTLWKTTAMQLSLLPLEIWLVQMRNTTGQRWQEPDYYSESEFLIWGEKNTPIELSQQFCLRIKHKNRAGYPAYMWDVGTH